MNTVIVEYTGEKTPYGQSTFDTIEEEDELIAKEFEESHTGLKVIAINFKPVSFVRDDDTNKKDRGES